MPPIFSFRVTNSSAVMLPACSAFRPYCTPALSRVLRALPSWSLPQIDAAQSQALQRSPVGFSGLYTIELGSWQLLIGWPGAAIAPVSLLVTKRCTYTPALPLLPNALYQPWQPVWSTCPLMAVFLALICAWV